MDEDTKRKRNVYLATLGLPPYTSLADARKAHKKLLYLHHPDRIAISGLSFSAANDRSKEINQAMTELEKIGPTSPTISEFPSQFSSKKYSSTKWEKVGAVDESRVEKKPSLGKVTKIVTAKPKQRPSVTVTKIQAPRHKSVQD